MPRTSPPAAPMREEAKFVRTDRFRGRADVAYDRHVEDLAFVQRLVHLRRVPMRGVEREALFHRVDVKIDELQSIRGRVQFAQRLVDRLGVRFVLRMPARKPAIWTLVWSISSRTERRTG